MQEEVQIPDDLLVRMEIQEYIINLTDANLEDTVAVLLKHEFCRNKENVSFIADEIVRTVPLRQKRWIPYALLIKKIMFANPQSTSPWAQFRSRVLDGIFHPTDEWKIHDKAPLYHFARVCLQQGTVTINEMINRVTRIPLVYPCQYFIAACFFIPEISAHSQGVYKSILQTIKKFEVPEENTRTEAVTEIPTGTKVKIHRIKDPIVQKYINDFDNLAANNFQKLLPLIECGCEFGSPALDIYNDDVDGIASRISRHFNINQRIEPNPFHPAMFVQWKPTLLEFAAFYGSVNVFKFLLSQRAKTAFIPIMATAGGFPEILNGIGGGPDLPYENCLKIAGAFRDMDTLLWIKNTHPRDFKFAREINYVLARAAFTNSLRLMKYCLENGADVNFRDENEQTPLHLAVTAGSLEALQFLLAQPHIHIKKKNLFGWNPHSIANDRIVKAVLAEAEELRKEQKLAKAEAKKKKHIH